MKEKETISIQWKNYEVDSLECDAALESVKETIQELRKEHHKTLIHPFMFDNKDGNMFECIEQNVGGTYGDWINHFITLTKLQKNKKVVGFSFSDSDHLLKEAIANKPVEKKFNDIL